MNEPQILLHVGFPKTATTWLQHILQDNQHVNYLGKYYGVTNRWQSEVFNDVIVSLRGMGPKVDAQRLDDAILEAWDANPGKPIIISEEVLAKPWKGDGEWVEKFSQLLHGYFPEAKVLLTLRRQSDIACSMYRKYVSINGLQSQSMRQWFESGGGSINVNFWDRWNLLNLYHGLDQEFSNNLTVIPYESMKLDSNKFCNDIACFFNIDPAEFKVSDEYNVSAFQTDFVRLFRSCIDPRLWSNVMQNIKLKPKYDDRIIADIKSYFDDSNHRLAIRSGLDLAQYDYYINK